MRVIPINEIPENMHKIELQNGQVATLTQAIMTIVPEVHKERETMVLKYNIPCPVCGYDNIGFSYDGKVFANIQLNCRWCGVFFRPVIKRG